ncbi:angiopoietin-related protein 1 [Elysia marginata]|uniref:Angiopoietin-related protein 1 n=1 Tax=Elysia marginata TaxID=1093978 RepID=A0AAV4EPN3_9GAST|nr:angiopoietin-related protein 1 [Elysia marginata]
MFSPITGLDFNLNRENPFSAAARNLCGILTCEEEITNTSVSSKSDRDLPGFNSISEMSVFKRSPTLYGNAKSEHNALIASITSQSPGLSSVANGRKIDGLLDAIRGSLRVEMVKEEDCKAEFICQVRGLDIQGRQAVSTTNLVQQRNQANNQVNAASWRQGTSLQLLAAIQQLVGSLEKNMEDRLKSLEDTVGQQQKYMEDRIDSLEHRLDDRLNLFENRVESKIDDNNNLNRLMELDFKVSRKLTDFRSEAKTDILNSLDAMQQGLYTVQKDALKNVSEIFQKTVNDTSSLLTSMEGDFDILKSYGHINLLTVRNETENIKQILTSGEALSRCIDSDTTSSEKNQLLPLTCHRGMGNEVNKSYPHFVMTTDFTLQRQILCDTQTDGGGWTVIQQRFNGAVFFNRDWQSYKEGFGKIEPYGEFWLGNEAVHLLTYVRPYELRVEIRSDNKDYVALYKTFKLENEANKYRIRLGKVTSSIDDGSRGLSYSNNAKFSTFDNDNDDSSGQCAVTYKSGWWYKNCEYSKLNTPWRDGKIPYAWYTTGSKYLHAVSTSMKIRPL